MRLRRSRPLPCHPRYPLSPPATLDSGFFWGKKIWQPPQRKKSGLILEQDLYRYQIYCSAIAGQDIRAHDNTAETAIRAVRTGYAPLWRNRETGTWTGECGVS